MAMKTPFIGEKNAAENFFCTFLVYTLFFKDVNKLTWRGVDSIAITPGAAEHSCCCIHTVVAVVFICVVQDADAVGFFKRISHAISGR
jgi:hypothetical protein